MLLRYVGNQSVTFMSHGVGSLDPGDTFHVEDDQADRFLSRSDIVEAEGTETATGGPEDPPAAESTGDEPEVAGDPTERQDDAPPVPDKAPTRRRRTAPTTENER